jgi:D-glucosaminate-6-phosphate ammonia-lyase
MTIYDTLGVRTIVNATGVFTRLGGSLMPPEVLEAMAQAAQHYVCLEELQYRAGQAIAGMVGAETAYILSGAQAGIVLSIAACMTGLDPAKMDRLPETTGMKNEVLMARGHRNSYDHGVEAAGARIVEVGTEQGCTPQELAAAIGERTAAIFFVPERPHAGITLAEAVAVGKAYGVPVVVDGSGRLDVPSRLQGYVSAGPDLVIFSGGKFIRGPQSSGFVCGRKELVAAIAWQHLDMDVTQRIWRPPPDLLDVKAMPFIPRQGIGRGYKAGKEEIVGLVTALRLYLQRDWAAERTVWERRLRHIVDGLADLPHVEAHYHPTSQSHPGLPFARIAIDEDALGISGYDFYLALVEGDPPVHASDREVAQGAILINPFGLQEGDDATIVRRVREIVEPIIQSSTVDRQL